MSDITLSSGNDSYTYTRGITNDTIYGGAGDDTLTIITSGASGGTVTLDGGIGDDELNADYNATIVIGGDGNDVANLPLYDNNSLRLTTDAQGRYVISANYTYYGNQVYTIDPSVETVHFQDNYYGYYSNPPAYVAYADIPKFVGSNAISADYANTTTQHIIGTANTDVVYFNGNTNDYTYSELPSFIDPISGQTRAGDITLTATNGSGTYTIASNAEYVHFLNGQTLDFSALPGTLAASTAPAVSDQIITGDYLGSHIYVGGAGDDTLTLYGATKDYVIKAVTAYAADAPDTAVSHGQAIDGLELIATNGSGVYVIDPSIEQVLFSGGGGLVSHDDLTSQVTAAPSTVTTDTLHLRISGADYGDVIFGGDSYNDRVLLDSFYGGTLSRDDAGDFVLNGYSYYGSANTLVLKESVESVQLYTGGPVFALADLPHYVSGDPTFTGTTAANDILYNAPYGDQYLVGGAGLDSAYLSGNVKDYAIQAVNLAATATTPAVDGYELISFNGSGNIYIDQSTEVVHMQDGTLFTLVDLPAFITQHYAPGGVGTGQDDVFLQSISGNQSFVGAAGTDIVYLRGNPSDYGFTAVSTPADGTTPATHGELLHALNNSGDLYVDSTTESVRFANGLYASFVGLQSFG
jgi:hypothetical protein